MADLISRKALVTKLSQGYWDWELQKAKNDPCVIDAMIDWAIRIVKEMPLESPWHTGTPTEDGLYVVYYLDDHNPSATPYEVLYDGFLSPDGEGNWIDRDGEIRFIDDDIVRWQKIEPYKEKNNG